MRRMFFKKEGDNWGKRFFLWWYKWLSNYNSSPSWAVYWLVGLILLSWLFFGLTDWSWYKALGIAIESVVPVLPKIKVDEMSNFQRVVFDLERFFALIIWTLLILSIRRKFKR